LRILPGKISGSGSVLLPALGRPSRPSQISFLFFVCSGGFCHVTTLI
jgi:hypothetical protein